MIEIQVPLRTVKSTITNMNIEEIMKGNVRKPYLLEENVINLFSNVCSKSQKLSIYSMENCLEEISLPRVFTIKQFKKLGKTNSINKMMVKKLELNELFFYWQRIKQGWKSDDPSQFPSRNCKWLKLPIHAAISSHTGNATLNFLLLASMCHAPWQQRGLPAQHKKLLQQKPEIALPAPEKIVACIGSFTPNIQFHR